ncbi:YgfZ/GcvT domain-containing protein [Rubritalea tangerina]|uniref:YgfZ/GcvT domain-containing protein n=1 Tax=Rubritalea tangerina TaxID=430798 RepID=A0ABW4ZDB9_9BACT
MQPFTIASGSQALLTRAIFQLSGPDAERYLNGQCTQDVSLASTTSAVYALVTNFKGKLDGDCYIRRHEDALLIDCPIDLRESLFMRLDRYIIADDAELTDLTDQYKVLHTIAETPPSNDAWTCLRFGQDGYDQLVTPDYPAPTNTTPDQLEKARISHKIPLWGAELDHDTLPPEAGLEQRAISYTKGCYTGQEVISRMRSAGKTNRHLVLLKLTDSSPAGTPLTCEGATPDKPAGSITSTCVINETQIALAYRKRKFQEHSTFTTDTATATVIS